MRHPSSQVPSPLFLAIGLACGGAVGDGAAVSSAAYTLEYTQWSMDFSIGEGEYYTIDFLGDGTWMSDGAVSGNTWSLSGDHLTMADTDGYTYDAKFVDSWTIGGMVTQTSDGETWPFRMTRTK